MREPFVGRATGGFRDHAERVAGNGHEEGVGEHILIEYEVALAALKKTDQEQPAYEIEKVERIHDVLACDSALLAAGGEGAK